MRQWWNGWGWVIVCLSQPVAFAGIPHHVTRHTSNITRHTSHVTHHAGAFKWSMDLSEGRYFTFLTCNL